MATAMAAIRITAADTALRMYARLSRFVCRMFMQPRLHYAVRPRCGKAARRRVGVRPGLGISGQSFLMESTVLAANP